MKLIILLVVLGLRRFDIGWPAWMNHRNGAVIFSLPGLSAVSGEAAGWLLKVFLPGVVVALVMYGLNQILWGVPVWFAGGLLLLWCIGIGSEFRALDEVIALGRLNDAKGVAETTMDQWGFDDHPKNEGFFVRLCQVVGEREASTVFAALFYFITLGYPALVIFSLNRWLAQQDANSEDANNKSGAGWARICEEAFLWLPSRLFIVALALAADFRRVMQAVEGRLWQPSNVQQVNDDALRAALGIDDDDNNANMENGVELLEELQSLLLRVLAIWLIFSATWVLLLG